MSDSVEYLTNVVREIRDSLESLRYAEFDLVNSPFGLMKPTMTIDGNQFCFLLGENLQSGLAGFGDTARLAAIDFNRQFNEYSVANRVHK